ncbi:MAG: amidohydrolase family protein [Chlamydiales bacterium]|nr:amidohydrolase family protein [Chlamydiales bacterium]
MITIKRVELINGSISDVTIDSCTERLIDGNGLTLLPALIDPTVNFRVPGSEHKEDWVTGAQAALAGGVSTVFDMPGNNPACCSQEGLHAKLALIKLQLQEAGLPLRYHLYLGADREHLNEIPKVKHEIIGIKMFMSSASGGMLIDDEGTQEEVFKLAAQYKLLLAVYAEDDSIIRRNKESRPDRVDPSIHSKIRSREAAIKAVERAVALTEKYQTRLLLLHCSTKEEVAIVREAKAKGLPVYAEACTRHMFLDESAYKRFGMLAKINPPLRTAEDRLALWEAIHDGTIDIIGSDHSPHTQTEKSRPYDQTPAGAPGVELTLPLLLDATNHGWLTLQRLVELTRTNVEKIYGLSPNDDVVLVDRRLRRTVTDEDLKTRVRWSLFKGLTLTGWPVTTIIRGNIIDVGVSLCHRVS